MLDRSPIHRTFSPIETEIWEFEDGGDGVSKPFLPDATYMRGFALFSVDFEFCKK